MLHGILLILAVAMHITLADVLYKFDIKNVGSSIGLPTIPLYRATK